MLYSIDWMQCDGNSLLKHCSAKTDRKSGTSNKLGASSTQRSASITAIGCLCGARNGHWCTNSYGRLGSRGCGIGQIRRKKRHTAHISRDVNKVFLEVRGIFVRASILEGAGFDPVILDGKYAVASFLLGGHFLKGAGSNESEGGHCLGITAC